MDIMVIEKLPEFRLFLSRGGEEMTAIRMPSTAERSSTASTPFLPLPILKQKISLTSVG